MIESLKKTQEQLKNEPYVKSIELYKGESMKKFAKKNDKNKKEIDRAHSSQSRRKQQFEEYRERKENSKLKLKPKIIKKK